MTESTQGDRWPTARRVAPLLTVVTLQALVVFFIRSDGPFAISDDDAARVVIAQKFVETPTLDPSGTSWLPIPFLLTGVFMLAFGATLEAARALSLLHALATGALLYGSARLLGAPRWGSALGAGVAVVLPLSAHLAAATVPEYPTAALVVWGATTAHAARERGSLGDSLRWTGGLAFFLACGSRYETWAPAFVFGLLQLLDARSSGEWRKNGFAALLAWVFPVLWLIHGQLHHGSPFFFVQRVVDYHDALGRGGSLVEALRAYPLALLRIEPELIGATIGVTLALLAKGRGGPHLPHRALLVLGVLVAFLTLGAVRGGAPTHHPERALLSCFLFVPLWLAAEMGRRPAGVQLAGILACAGALLGFGFRISASDHREGNVDRSLHEEVGAFVRAQLPPGERVALALSDFGYFSVMAAAGHPERFEVLDRHDPRDPKETVPLEIKIEAFVEEGGCLWVSEGLAQLPGSERLFSRGDLAVHRATTCPAPPE